MHAPQRHLSGGLKPCFSHLSHRRFIYAEHFAPRRHPIRSSHFAGKKITTPATKYLPCRMALRKLFPFIILAFLAFAGYARPSKRKNRHRRHHTRAVQISLPADSVSPDSLISFAESMIGTPYRYATSDPLTGFDCSGFVSYVFKHFEFDVPRSSRDFASVGEKISLADAMPGDIILFTGTARHSHRIGHIAIVVRNDDGELKFIHSTSGKEHGVTITEMNDRYKSRYVEVIRLLKRNDELQDEEQTARGA